MVAVFRQPGILTWQGIKEAIFLINLFQMYTRIGLCIREREPKTTNCQMV